MHKALHPRDDVDRLYTSRIVVVGGLASITVNVDTSIKELEDYIFFFNVVLEQRKTNNSGQ